MRIVTARRVLLALVGWGALVAGCTAATGGPGTTQTLQPAAVRPIEPFALGRQASTGDLDGLEASELESELAREEPSPAIIEGRLAPVEASPNVTDAERSEGAASRGAFAYWDKDDDGLLTADELTDTMIAAWDEDDDGAIDRAEWPG